MPADCVTTCCCVPTIELCGVRPRYIQLNSLTHQTVAWTTFYTLLIESATHTCKPFCGAASNHVAARAVARWLVPDLRSKLQANGMCAHARVGTV